MGGRKTVVLKARQLGITWLAGGFALWHLLFRPGTRVLAVSINEKEASKLVRRIWAQYRSLPAGLCEVKVLKPARGAEPSDTIEVRHPDGRISTILALPSTKTAGHGETAALVILDEFARQEYASETWKAVLPTASKGGRILVISTGNGISVGEGQGNYFHHVYKHAEVLGIESKFLRWDLHPDRDDAWYGREAMALPSVDRGEQYPRDEDEAFILSGDPFFDRDALAYYRSRVREPLYRCEFAPGRGEARLRKLEKGCIRVYEQPGPDGKYAIGADTATGRGLDYSAGFVIDLATMAPVAEVHGKLDPDVYAAQLHFLGRWYGTARIAVESAGGFGEPVTIFLRDGKDGRPAYPKLYRHRQFSRPDQQEHKPFGFPINAKTRPQVIAYLEKCLRERVFPYLPADLLGEMGTFVRRTTNPSPRAQEGTNDDRVMAWAVACEMFRQYGEHPHRYQPKPRRRKSRELNPDEMTAAQLARFDRERYGL